MVALSTSRRPPIEIFHQHALHVARHVLGELSAQQRLDEADDELVPGGGVAGRDALDERPRRVADVGVGVGAQPEQQLIHRRERGLGQLAEQAHADGAHVLVRRVQHGEQQIGRDEAGPRIVAQQELGAQLLDAGQRVAQQIEEW